MTRAVLFDEFVATGISLLFKLQVKSDRSLILGNSLQEKGKEMRGKKNLNNGRV